VENGYEAQISFFKSRKNSIEANGSSRLTLSNSPPPPLHLALPLINREDLQPTTPTNPIIMINYFHPIDNYYDDDYYLSPRAQRELRRRRELEFYRQQEEQEEARRAAYELRRRREQQHLRELQRRRELEEEEQRQRAYYRTQQEKQRRRRGPRREEPVARKNHLSTLEQEDEPPMYQVVQGPDGRLYRIPAVQEELKVPRRPQYTVMRGPGGRLYRFRTTDSSSDAQDGEPETITTRSSRDDSVEDETFPEQLDSMETLDEENVPPKDATKKAQHLGKVGTAHTGRSQQRKKKKRLTVIVEDASDSEMEDDELNSVWRHRRPSPGEWMEPVDN